MGFCLKTSGHGNIKSLLLDLVAMTNEHHFTDKHDDSDISNGFVQELSVLKS